MQSIRFNRLPGELLPLDHSWPPFMVEGATEGSGNIKASCHKYIRANENNAGTAMLSKSEADPIPRRAGTGGLLCFTDIPWEVEN